MATQYVIVDLEWIENHVGRISPTQLAAMRVNSDWEMLDMISTYIKPMNKFYHNWNHVAYNGGATENFLMGRNAYNAFDYFESWLEQDDIICWWYESGADVYKKLAQCILKRKLNHKSIIIGEYFKEYFKDDGKSINPYKILSEMNITTEKPEHCSKNDVKAMQKVLKNIRVPQSFIDSALYKNEKATVKQKAKSKSDKGFVTNLKLPYQFDEETGLLHKNDSDCIIEGKNYRSFSSIKDCIRNKYKACPVCMKEELNEKRKAICRELIDKNQYNYIYLKNSKVFHRHDCKLIRISTDVTGCKYYSKAAATGRTPCKVCNPTAAVEEPKKQANIFAQTPKKEVQTALARLERAKNERFNGVLKNNAPQLCDKDIKTLTHTGYVFWAATGYETFHLRNCPKLKGLTDLKGFSKYGKAIEAGYKPCRKCNPTKKDNITVSLPITSRVRDDEKISDISRMCRENGYGYYSEDDYFYIETPVGKWKIDTLSFPIQLQHINLMTVRSKNMNYHKQPRVFLSFTDTFLYIKRHDSSLLNKEKQEPSFSEMAQS